MYSRNKCSLCKVIIFFVVKATSATLTDGCGILGKSSQSLPIKKNLGGSSRLLTKVLIYKGTMHHWHYINWIKPPLRKRTMWVEGKLSLSCFGWGWSAGGYGQYGQVVKVPKAMVRLVVLMNCIFLCGFLVGSGKGTHLGSGQCREQKLPQVLLRQILYSTQSQCRLYIE